MIKMVSRQPRSKFIRVRCKDCSNEQVIFNKAITKISCNICGSTLTEPAGGKAKILAEILEEIE